MAGLSDTAPPPLVPRIINALAPVLDTVYVPGGSDFWLTLKLNGICARTSVASAGTVTAARMPITLAAPRPFRSRFLITTSSPPARAAVRASASHVPAARRRALAWRINDVSRGRARAASTHVANDTAAAFFRARTETRDTFTILSTRGRSAMRESSAMTAHRSLSRTVRNKFIAGLVIVIPIVLTVKALWWLFTYVDSLAAPLAEQMI